MVQIKVPRIAQVFVEATVHHIKAKGFECLRVRKIKGATPFHLDSRDD